MAALRQFRIDYDFTVDTDLFSLRFVEADVGAACLRREGPAFRVCLPRGFALGAPARQEWANNVLLEVLRLAANEQLPRRLADAARRYGVNYRRLTVRNVRTRWGSCSAAGNINLSLWLMLAPARLVDYVIVHELAHRREMNHGPHFWQEVDRMAGGPGSGRRLEREMREFTRRLWREP